MTVWLIKLCHLIVYLVVICWQTIDGFPNQGKWSYNVSQRKCHYFEVNSALYANSSISIKISCDSLEDKDLAVRIGWTIRETPCFEEYLGPEIALPEFLKWYYFCPATPFGDFGYDRIQYLKTNEVVIKCNQLKNLSPKGNFVYELIGSTTNRSCSPPDVMCSSSPETTLLTLIGDYSESSRTIDADKTLEKRSSSSSSETLPTPLSRIMSGRDLTRMPSLSENELTVPNDGVYLLVVYIESMDSSKRFNAEVDIEMKTQKGQYLSAIDWPLLPFYGVMCGVYVVFAFSWLLVAFLQWRDLLRIQFWIGAVIFLGMFEKAVFYAEYQSINSTGVSVKGAVLFAEIMSCFKRTLARMLVIIVSCGFGIVKPRLGPILHRVVCVGGIYFILGSIEAILRIYKPKTDPTNQTLMAGIPLAVLDSVICWWVFSSLVQTTRILRLRRNVVKLNLYKQFTNTLIFAVLASIIFMIWQIHNHKLTQCLNDWTFLWFDEAFWHILFSAVLLVIMILWRPTNNNQRYAFTPLLDASEDEDEEQYHQIPHEAFDGMKMRGKNGTHFETNDNNSNSNDISKETEDNLKWIEANIPTSMIDNALPALIDSDEEIMTTHLEMNKME
ncbi:transmembrane protein 87A-like [Oppia nitens]|uniref:transmembrane protein 87A-like n=1 Tax=Oppia nitens TaxID=1686743 RepID=UPI0023DB9D56|nr:transmembrane protein 87A-like [Oppia nitens]